MGADRVRVREREALAALVEPATRRTGLTLVEIVGEPGSGRSHLLRWLDGHLRERGIDPILIAGWPGRGSSWRTLPDLAQDLQRGVSARGSDAIERVVRDVLRQSDRAAALFADVTLTASQPSLALAMAERLGEAPSAMLVDGAHAAERVLWRFLGKALAAAPAGPRLVVAAGDGSRDVELPFPGTRCHERLTLPPLPEEEIDAMLQELGVSGEVAARAAAELHERLLRHPGQVKLVAGQLLDGPADEVMELLRAEGLRGMLRRRLGGLDEAAAGLLEIASVSGSGINLWRLRQLGLATDASRPEIEAVTDRLESLRILKRSFPGGKLRLVFAEADERLLAYERLDEEKRRLLHASFARVLREDDLDPEDRHSEAGRHLFLSGDEVGGAAELLDAGRHLMRRGRMEEARRHFEEVGRRARRSRALASEDALAEEGIGDVESQGGTFAAAAERFAEALRRGEAILGRPDRVRLLHKLARCRLREGRLDDVEPLAVDALSLCEDADASARAQIMDLLSVLAQRKGDLTGAQSISARAHALAVASRDEAVLATVQRTQGSIRLDQGEVHAAVEDLETARLLWERQGDPMGYATVCVLLGNALSAMGDAGAAAHRYREALRIHEAMGNLAGMAVALNNLGTLSIGEEDLPEARRYFAEAARLQRRLGDPRSVCVTMVNEASVAQSMGMPAEALRVSAEALALAERSRNVMARLAVLTVQSSILATMGRLAEARALARDVQESAAATGHVQYLLWGRLAEVDVVQVLGGFDRAEEVVRSCLREAQAHGFADTERDCLTRLVEIHRLRGSAARARAYLDELRTRLGARSDSEARSHAMWDLEIGILDSPLSPEGRRLLAEEAERGSPWGRPRAHRILSRALPAEEALAHAQAAWEMYRQLEDREEGWRAVLHLGELERRLGLPDAARHMEEAARLILSTAADLSEEDREAYLSSHKRRTVLRHSRRLE